MQYDALGNMTVSFDAGDDGAQDDAEAVIAYSTCPGTYVFGIPTSIHVTGGGGLLRKREAVVDCATGDLTKVSQFLANGDAAETDLGYFANGNLKSVTGPPNHHGQRYKLEYTYDPTVDTHVASVTDSFGYTSASTYNLKYGKALTATDLNNNVTSYTCDQFGRMTSLTGPYEQG